MSENTDRNGSSALLAGLTSGELLCFERGMDQWAISIRRPDMQEKDRVAGALLAYQRQAFALGMVPPSHSRDMHEALVEAREQVEILQARLGIKDYGHGTLSIIDAALSKATAHKPNPGASA